MKGRTGIGMRKHRTSGKTSYPPNVRLAMKLDAEKSKKRRYVKMYNTPQEAFAEMRKA